MAGTRTRARNLARHRPAHAATPLLACLLPCLMLGACGGEPSETLGTRMWGSIEVAVQTRPFPPLAGNDEVVVIVSGEHHRPVYDAIVSLRTQPLAPWVQAIQDGHLGVYRRAVRFSPDPGGGLEVQLRRGEEQTVIVFPVAIASAR
jgi:hypothetical protein